MSLRERFESKYVVDPVTDCWVWTDKPDAYGYGALNVDGVPRKAHQLAWLLYRGPIPPETPCVLHHCDNPPCVNWVSHLWLGTKADNSRDMAAKGRSGGQKKTHCPHGHPYSGDNLYVSPKGWRYCRACMREANTRIRRNKRGAAYSGFPVTARPFAAVTVRADGSGIIPFTQGAGIAPC